MAGHDYSGQKPIAGRNVAEFDMQETVVNIGEYYAERF